MRRVALSLAGLYAMGVVVGCELLVGIKDKSESGASDAAFSDVSTGDANAADPDVPCMQQPTNLFCDDFDSEPEAGDGWLWDIAMGGGSVDLDTVDFASSSRSARFTIPSPTASAQLGQNVGSDLSTGYRLAFDLRLDVAAADLPSIPQVAAAQLYRTSGSDQLTVAYVLGPGAQSYLQLYEGSASSPTNLPLDEMPPLQKWTRLVLVYDIQQGVTVIEDGATIGTSTAAAHGPPGTTSIIVGAVYSNPPGSAVTLEVDNVVLRGQ
ncbi:MAG TPA: hypothetical protein VIJ22_14205 [Polyangiaceae bacterium]